MDTLTQEEIDVLPTTTLEKKAMNYDEMEAGRELDVLVAERVMNWRWLSLPVADARRRWFLDSPNECAKRKPEYIRENVSEEERVIFPGKYPQYSTDIAAAWEVIELLRTRGWRVDLSCSQMVQKSYTCYLSYDWDKEPTRSETAHAETMPLAIVRAALKAVQSLACGWLP